MLPYPLSFGLGRPIPDEKHKNVLKKWSEEKASKSRRTERVEGRIESKRQHRPHERRAIDQQESKPEFDEKEQKGKEKVKVKEGHREQGVGTEDRGGGIRETYLSGHIQGAKAKPKFTE